MYWLARKLLFLLPAEAAHHVGFFFLRLLAALDLLRLIAGPRPTPDERERLQVRALGLTFPSPVGLAAGFDKDAIGYEALGQLGFGFVEVGTLTHEAQPGNEKPRLFRLPSDRALINRMGFNNRGSSAAAARLKRRRDVIVGVNIGKTKRISEADAIADYEQSARELAPLADYLVVNVSSPNTPGLRDLQAAEKLRPLLQAVQRAVDEACTRRVPLLVKIAPDLSDEDIAAVANLAKELHLDGIIATNTTIERDGLRSAASRVAACGAGGLSGAPLKQRSRDVLRQLHRIVGDELVLIAAGGIESADDVLDRLEAGATLVQLYTAFVYQGPALPRRINRELAKRLPARR